MLSLFKPKRQPLPQTQADMDQLAVDFLQEQGFPVTNDMMALFGSFLAHSDPEEDTFDPKQVAKRMRKQIASSLTFYLVHPERRPKVEDPKDSVLTSELPDESKL